jgi:hypothetical protein
MDPTMFAKLLSDLLASNTIPSIDIYIDEAFAAAMDTSLLALGFTKTLRAGKWTLAALALGRYFNWSPTTMGLIQALAGQQISENLLLADGWARRIDIELAIRNPQKYAIAGPNTFHAGVCLANGIARVYLALRTVWWCYKVIWPRVVATQRYRDWQVKLRTFITSRFSKGVNEDIRLRFQCDFAVHPKKSPSGHSHGLAAANRTAAASAMKSWIVGMGFIPYVVSTSTRDVDEEGSHQHYMAKDVVHAAKDDPVTKNHIIYMVDVDYYLDMPRWIAKGQPIVMHTFTPPDVAGPLDNACFTIRNNKVQVNVNGGGFYEHELWNYNSDYGIVDVWWGSVVYAIEHRQIDEHHHVVCLIPRHIIRGPLGRLMPGTRLTRLNFKSYPTVNRLDSITETGERYVSLGKEGAPFSVRILASLLESIIIRLRESKRWEIHSVERFLSLYQSQYPHPAETAAQLFDILMAMTGLDPNSIEIQARAGPVPIVRYQAVGPPTSGYSITEDGAEIGRAVGVCIVTRPPVVPNSSRNNDVACLTGRVIGVHNQNVPGAKFETYAKEFAAKVVPIPGVGIPWDTQDVMLAVSKPSTRQKYERGFGWIVEADEPLQVQSFQKAESYGGVKPSRNISQVSGQHNIKLSSFCYPFAIEVCKGLPWYIPGNNPPEIANRLCRYVVKYGRIVETDFSTFDGTVSKWMRSWFQAAIFGRWVHPDYRRQMIGLIHAEVEAKGKTKHGVPYRPSGSVLSGSLLTTFNTLMNGFIAYAAGRHAGLESEEAWDMIGPMCGDDGISAASPEALNQVAIELGVSLKCEIRNKGDYVMFLGRMFLDPWTLPASVQDPVRTWIKLHCSFANPTVPDYVALYYRASGYLELDALAPITSAWCEYSLAGIQRDHPDIESEVERLRSTGIVDVPYFVQHRTPETTGGWPQSAGDDRLLYQRVAERSGFDVSVIRRWHDLIRTARTDAEIQGAIDLPPEPPKLRAIIHDGAQAPIDGPNPDHDCPTGARLDDLRFDDLCNPAVTATTGEPFRRGVGNQQRGGQPRRGLPPRGSLSLHTRGAAPRPTASSTQPPKPRLPRPGSQPARGGSQQHAASRIQMAPKTPNAPRE